MPARQRHPPRQVAAHDLLAGGAHRVDPALAVAAHQHTAAQTEDQCRDQRPGQRLYHDLAKVAALLGVAADEQANTLRKRNRTAANDMRRARLLADAMEAHLEPAADVVGDLRPVVQVAGQRPQIGIGEQVHVRGVAIRPAAFGDHLDQPGQALVAILLAKPADLGLDRLAHLAVDQARGGPVDERDQRGQGDAEQRQIEDRDLEAGGA
jgi:hypothetical protein